MTDYTELMRRAKESTGISDVSVAPDVLIGLFTDLDEARNGMKYSCAIRLKKEIERLESEAVYSAAGFDAAREEIARLKAEVAGLRTGYEAYERVNAELKAEVEALRKLGPSKEIIWCACGDGHAANSYGAGFMDANEGVCANCDAALGQGEQS